MEILIAVAGVLVMVMVVSGMVLLTPTGTEQVRRAFEVDGTDGAGQGGQLSPRPGRGPAREALDPHPLDPVGRGRLPSGVANAFHDGDR